jgi:hypothetical protein
MFHRKLNIPGILQKEAPGIQYMYDNYIKELQSRLQSSYELAKSSLIANEPCSMYGSNIFGILPGILPSPSPRHPFHYFLLYVIP